MSLLRVAAVQFCFQAPEILLGNAHSMLSQTEQALHMAALQQTQIASAHLSDAMQRYQHQSHSLGTAGIRA